MSTYFLPAEETARRQLLTTYGNWPFHVQSNDIFLTATSDVVAQIRSNILEVDSHGWAGCSPTQDGSPPLPCRTSAAPVHCVDGDRHCGTLEENSQDVFAEFGVEVPEHYYLFTIEFVLDANPTVAALLFKGFYEISGSGYEVQLRDGGHNPLRVGCLPLSSQSVSSYADGLRFVQHRCAEPTASEETLRELARTRFVKVLLPGAFRQFWVERVRIKFRRMDVPPSPPPAPREPPVPPQPVAPPDAPVGSCTPYIGLSWPTGQFVVLSEEPCGLSHEQCCEIAREHAATSYILSSSGCCSVVSGVSGVPSVVVPGGSGSVA